MAPPGAAAIARLKKRDVEALLDGYDADPVGSLRVALAIALDADTATPWADLVRAAPLPDATQARLQAKEQDALDELARLLNEAREFTPPG